MAGRKSKLTTELQDQICSHLRAGVTIDTTCAIVGIADATFYDWIQRGEGDHPTRSSTAQLVEFVEAIKRARAEGEAYHVVNIRNKSAEHWQASAWFLERVYPDKYGKTRIELTGKEGDPIKVEHDISGKILADPEAVDLVAQLYERLAMGEADPGGTG